MKTYFPNLGDPPFNESNLKIAQEEILAVFPNVKFDIKSEEHSVYKPGTKAHKLAKCGVFIPVEPEDTIVQTFYDFTVEAYNWEFSRSWRYWCARTNSNPIPEDLAKALNDNFGAYIRVDGFAGGTNVTGPVYSYHIDTSGGLLDLSNIIKSL